MLKRFFLSVLFTSCIFGQQFKWIGNPAIISAFETPNYEIHPLDENMVYTSTGDDIIFISNDGYNATKYVEIEQLGNGNSPAVVTLPNTSIHKSLIFGNIDGYSVMGEFYLENISVTDTNFEYLPHAFNPLNNETVYAAKDFVELWRSYDGGMNWQFVAQLDRRIHSIAVAETDSSMIYVGLLSGLRRSSDHGLSWMAVWDTTAQDRVISLKVNPFNKKSVYFVFGTSIRKSEDGGFTYRELTNYPLINCVELALDNQDTLTLYATGNYFLSFSVEGHLYKSTNEGSSWNLIQNGIPDKQFWIREVKISKQNRDHLFVGVLPWGMFKSTNGGMNWFHTKLLHSEPAYIEVSADNKLLIGTWGWGMWKTSDEGQSWLRPSFDPDSSLWMAEPFTVTFHPILRSNGFFAFRSSLFKSTDYGDSWQTINSLSGVTKVKYHPFNPGVVFAVVSNSHGLARGLYKSDDNGENWLFLGDIRPLPLSFDRKKPDLVYSFGYYNNSNWLASSSTNMGNDWRHSDFGLLQEDGYAQRIYFVEASPHDSNVVYCGQAGGYNGTGGLSKSTNGGLNWIQIDSTLPDNRKSVKCILFDVNKKGRYYLGLTYMGYSGQPTLYSNGGLFLTENDGKTWKKIFGSAVSYITADSSNPRNIFIGTRFGVLKIIDTVTVDVKEKELSQPETFALYQNYPNPFNPTTKIKFSVPAGVGTRRGVSLRVFDILGREVATLVNEEKPAGDYEVEFKASHLPSGIYFYKLSVGDFVETKKMILIR